MALSVISALAPVAQTLDSAIHRINHYPVDKYLGNQLHYQLDRDLSIRWRYPPFEQLVPGGLQKQNCCHTCHARFAVFSTLPS